MNRSTRRAAIAVLTVVTAIIHLVLVFPQGIPGGIPFLLNGVGYLVLLALLWFKPSFVAGREKLLYYAFIGFTAITVVAYFAVNGGASFSNPVGLADKVIEVVLMALLWQDMQAEAA
jgi:hypothetical protein